MSETAESQAYVRARVAVLLEIGGSFPVIEKFIDGEPQLSLPGGNLHDGELAIEALHREVGEELGTEVSDPQLVLVQDMKITRPGRTGFYRKFHFVFHAKCRQPGLSKEDLERSAYAPLRWITLEEGAELPLYPSLRGLSRNGLGQLAYSTMTDEEYAWR